jgi:hypothetical protein
VSTDSAPNDDDDDDNDDINKKKQFHLQRIKQHSNNDGAQHYLHDIIHIITLINN